MTYLPTGNDRGATVILLRSYMMLRIVILSFGQLRGEYNQPRKIFFIFSKYLLLSKYVTHYDTFSSGKCHFCLY